MIVWQYLNFTITEDNGVFCLYSLNYFRRKIQFSLPIADDIRKLAIRQLIIDEKRAILEIPMP